MAVVLMSNPKDVEVSQRIQKVAQELADIAQSMVRAENPKDINYGSVGERAPEVENKGPRA